MHGRNIQRFLTDSSGGAFVYVGLTLFMVVGFAGLAVDAGHWYSTQRAAQAAADSAAMAGAREAMWGGDAVQAARDQALANGFDDNDPHTSVAVDTSYVHTNGTDTTTGVEVAIQRTSGGFFSSLFLAGDDAVDIAARSVAGQVAGVAACMLMMDPTMERAILLSGGSEIMANGCGLHANSIDSGAIDTTGGTVTAEEVSTSGDFRPGSEANITGDTASGVPPLTDPLAYMTPPSVGPCTFPTTQKVTGGASRTFGPGVYCGGIEGTGGAEIILRAGFYVIQDGMLLSSGGGVLKVDDADYAAGRGVSIYFTGIDARVMVTGGGQVTLRADTEGPMPGILFWGDFDPASKKDTHVFSGGTDTVYEGTIYFPDHHIEFTGGSTLEVAQVGAVIARSFKGGGGGRFILDNALTGSGNAVSAALGAQTVAVLE